MTPAPVGFFPVHDVVRDLVDGGFFPKGTADRFMAQTLEAARGDRFCMSLTMVAVVGRRPDR